MGSEMPDWVKLWEREPALRPEAIDSWDGRVFRSSHGDDVGNVAALCRDAAVRWLITQGIAVVGEPGRWQFLGWRNRVPFAHFPDGLNYDGALHFACGLELDARDAALSARAGEG